MPKTATDILENEILKHWPTVLEVLLKDHTTKCNIIWATDMYETEYGSRYAFDEEITIEKITGEFGTIIKPRSVKSLEEQKYRIRDKAEVFTPSWVCNLQNNLIDNAWFGRDNVFNKETIDKNGSCCWVPTEGKIEFDTASDWMKYIKDTRLEIACGEAPYLASRYDVITGQLIPIERRIGLLDRKLRVVSENTKDITEEMTTKQRKIVIRNWIRWAYRALQSIYGFEWQGDNLLIARETLFYTFIDYYQEKFKTTKTPEITCLLKVAEIISWNIWQMDGLKYGIPGYVPSETFDPKLFDAPVPVRERFCRIVEWEKQEPLKGKEIVFVSMLNKEKK